MATVLPFAGMRPPRNLAAQVAAPPYDVVDSNEARLLAAGNPHSFLHVSKPEIDLDPAIDHYSDAVYRQAADNFRRFVANGSLVQDAAPVFYLYRQTLGDHVQTGIVGLVSADEYVQDVIRKHELTRPDKENDRVRHMQAINAQSGPVFLTYRATKSLSTIGERGSKKEPVYDFVADSVRHQFWVLDDAQVINDIKTQFSHVSTLYVADGHHRSAAAVRYRDWCRQHSTGFSDTAPCNYFMAVLFPHDQLNILGYHRLLKDLSPYAGASFLEALGSGFYVSQVADNVMPACAGEFSLYLEGRWYRLSCSGTVAADGSVSDLDVTILQERVLTPLLGITDPRTDPRLDFLGGIHGQSGLEKAVDSGRYRAAIACYPVGIGQLMTIADAGKLMPPKSTWFEPKLKSGLVVHALD